MKLTEYVVEAQKTAIKMDLDERIEYNRIKIVCELAEVLDELVKAKYHGKKSVDDLIEEIGDVCWHVVDLTIALNLEITDKIETVNYLFQESNVERLIESMLYGICKFSHKNIFSVLKDICVSRKIDFEEVLHLNIVKLRARHGDTPNGKGFYK